MKATAYTRQGVEYGGRCIAYKTFVRAFLCNECGGGLLHRISRFGQDEVVCSKCGGEDFVSEHRFLEQIAEGMEAIDGLPEPLRSQMKGEPACQSATDAIADLFD